MRLSNGDVLLCWPLGKHVITAGWTYNDGKAHNAIDLRAAVGTPVYAAEGGTVDWVQHWDGHTTSGNQSYGNCVRITHEPYNGKALQTLYAHLKTVLVKTGQAVTEGQLIGYSGETGHCLGAHLHFEVRLASTRRNPLNWLDADFTCATDVVAKHLGAYTSVSVPEASDATPKLQTMCVVGATNEIIAKAKELGLPVTIKTSAEIGPASSGDCMTLWEMAKNVGVHYYSSYDYEEV